MPLAIRSGQNGSSWDLSLTAMHKDFSSPAARSLVPTNRRVNEASALEVMKAMLQMGKIDIKGLKQVYDQGLLGRVRHPLWDTGRGPHIRLWWGRRGSKLYALFIQRENEQPHLSRNTTDGHPKSLSHVKGWRTRQLKWAT
jgi:hypothetical protein